MKSIPEPLRLIDASFNRMLEDREPLPPLLPLEERDGERMSCTRCAPSITIVQSSFRPVLGASRLLAFISLITSAAVVLVSYFSASTGFRSTGSFFVGGLWRPASSFASRPTWENDQEWSPQAADDTTCSLASLRGRRFVATAAPPRWVHPKHYDGKEWTEPINSKPRGHDGLREQPVRGGLGTEFVFSFDVVIGPTARRSSSARMTLANAAFGTGFFVRSAIAISNWEKPESGSVGQERNGESVLNLQPNRPPEHAIAFGAYESSSW